MLFGFLRKGNKINKNQINEAKEKFSNLIKPHWEELQKIIKTHKSFNKYYEIDENPDVIVSISDLTVGCCLTFTKSCDDSEDDCNSKLLDPDTINKILNMEDKIVKALQKYCNDNDLDFKITANKNNWDDAGIFCSMDIGSLAEVHKESASNIFSNIQII